MEITSHSVWLRTSRITLYPLGDLHIGAPTSRFEEVERLMKGAEDGSFFVFLGDMIDNNLIDSFGDVYSQTISPQGQLQEFYSLLKEHKEKILGIVAGNHELRTKRRVGLDPFELLCAELDIPYSSTILALDISVGSNISRGSKRRSNYLLVIGHGYSAARTVGGKINANRRLVDVFPGADIYITGHTHIPEVHKEAHFTFDRYNKKARLHEYYVITIPAWLGYEEYAARKFYRPSSPGLITIELSGTDKQIEVKVR